MGRGMLQDKLEVRRGEPLLQGTVPRLQNLNLLHKLWEVCYWFGGNERWPFTLLFKYNSGRLQLMHFPYLRRLFEEVNMYLLEFEEHKGLVSALPPEENLKGQRKMTSYCDGRSENWPAFPEFLEVKSVLCCGRCDA